ncbi:MAG: hypothetical protein HC828_01575 [Blastochloris sp.]|nr:hypothetical protein [Blastochloris sp.]
MSRTYCYACGGATSLRDLDVALACGQRDFLVSVGTSTARHLRTLSGVRLVLDSAAWPLDNPKRPSFEAWYQELRGWRQAPDDYGKLRYAIAYDTIGNAAASERRYADVMGKMVDRAVTDLPIVPVLQFPAAPLGIGLDLLQSWAGQRDDMVDGGGFSDRPVYALGGLVPQRGRAAAVAWVQAVADELEMLIEDEGLEPEYLGIHVLGSTLQKYLTPLRRLGVPIWCDTSTPAQHASTSDASLRWGSTDRYGIPRDLLQRSRYARIAFWLCRERDRLGLPWTTPDLAWLEELPDLTPIVRPQQHALFAA